MQKCIEHIIGEYVDAKEYCELASTETIGKCKSIYRELGLNEIDHLEHLIEIYKIKCNDKSDRWIEFFKDEAEKLKEKLRQL